MHPLVAIGLVFLAGLAWMGTIVTLLIALARSGSVRRRTAGTVHDAETQLPVR